MENRSAQPLAFTLVAAYRGEHLILPRSADGAIGLPQIVHLPTDSDEQVRRRICALLGSRGSCVWIRLVGTYRIPESDREVRIVTCNFSGYFPPGWIAVKPRELPEQFIARHRPLVEAVVEWRLKKETEQARLEKLLKSVLDLDVRTGF